MTRRQAHARYILPVIALHWFTLILLVLVYACAELSEVFPKGSAGRAGLRTWHETLGLVVFGVVWLRLIARAFAVTPSILPAPPPWQALLAKVVHAVLYGLMIALPLSGWLMLSAAGKPIPFFGWELPALVAPNRAVASAIDDVHEAIAAVGYWLIGLHAAAALFHHYVVRDNTLRLMLPGARNAAAR